LLAPETAAELAAGSDLQATAEKEWWVEVSHCLLAGGGESPRPEGASNLPSVAIAGHCPLPRSLNLPSVSGRVEIRNPNFEIRNRDGWSGH
jgi:hypothetical protein